MSISAVSNNSQVYATPSYGSVNRVSDRDGDAGRVSGGGRHHGHGGGFMNDVVQALQGLGLIVPGAQSVGSAGGANTGTSAVSGTNAASSATDFRQALHTFMHDLHQALASQQGTGTQSAGSLSSTDSDGDNDGSGASQAVGGYNSFANNLQGLINSLGSNGSNSSSGANNQLQTDFSNLISSLGGNGSSASLTSFLTNLESKLSNNSATNTKGSIINMKG